MNTKKAIEILKQGNDILTGRIIKDLIASHKFEKIRTQNLFNEYQSDVEIKKRVFDDLKKVNSQLPNDYRGDIIDQVTGYLFGSPISYNINKTAYSEADFNKINLELKSFLNRNSIDDLDSTTGETSAICGYGFRLLYIDIDGKERAKEIKPWETIIIKDATIDEAQYGLIYYDIQLIENGETKKRIKVEFYDKQYIHFFVSTESGDFVRDLNEAKNPLPHLFEGVPIIRFDNNNILKGDFEKVNELIDAYDRLLSDMQNEVEEFRLAYLAFYGVEPTAEALEEARKTGAFQFPEGTDGKFIVKPLDKAVEFIKEQRNTLNENIYKFSKSIDMRNEKFSGSAISGESRKWQLVPLENKAKTKERKFTKALRQQFKLVAGSWRIKKIPLDPETLDFVFTRNLPVDLKFQAETTALLHGQVSELTRLSVLPIVKDPEKELAMMKEEANNIDFNIPPTP